MKNKKYKQSFDAKFVGTTPMDLDKILPTQGKVTNE